MIGDRSLPRVALSTAFFALLLACSPAAAPKPERAAPASEAKPSRPPAAEKAPVPAVEKKNLRVIFNSISMLAVPFWIADDAGLFQKYGLEADLRFVAGANAVPAMVADEVDIGVLAPEATMAVNAGGEDIVFIGSMIPGLIINLYAGPEIRQVADLRDKKIGITVRGSTTDYEAQHILRKAGLPLDSVSRIGMGSVPDVFVGLKTGAIEAGLLSYPIAAQAEEEGYRSIFEGKEIPYSLAPIMAKRTFVEAYPGTTQAFMKSVTEAIRRYESDAQFAKQILTKYVKITDQAVLDRTYSYYVSVYPDRPAINREQLATSYEWGGAENEAIKSVSLDRMIDNRAIQALDSQGFFSLAGSR